MAPRYQPPTRVTTLQMPYLALVTRADPEFERRKHREIEYEFAGRVFIGDPSRRGPYDRLSNIYPVGQPFGGLDPLITANLAPTTGNPSPGLYQGVAAGSWG